LLSTSVLRRGSRTSSSVSTLATLWPPRSRVAVALGGDGVQGEGPQVVIEVETVNPVDELGLKRLGLDHRLGFRGVPAGLWT
jgi:hypothetical protein